MARFFYENGKETLLGLNRVQYRALRVALGLMGTMPNIFLGVLSGIPPLEEWFAYLNFKYHIVWANLWGGGL
jgi:hypothetical protein